jgi:hypothetical protein
MSLVVGQLTVQTLASTTNAQVLWNTTTSLHVESFVVYAPSSNAGLVSIVGGTTTGTLANGLPLAAGDSMAFSADINRSGAYIDLKTVYWVGDTLSDKLACTFVRVSKG